MEAKRTESTLNILKPRTNDKQNMTQVMLTTTATTPITIASPDDAPVAMSDKPNPASTDSIPVKIEDTLETLSLSGTGKDQTVKSDEPENSEKVLPSNNVEEQVPTTTDTPVVVVEPAASDAKTQPATEATPPAIPEPFAQQLQQMAVDPVDQPDPRLLDALENPRDRLFVIKLEKDFVVFVTDENAPDFDLGPINSYHRLLAHKMAEYYRLTHLADTTGNSVKICRGESARIPPTQLCDWPVAAQQQQQQQAKAASNGVMPAVKIMRRTTPSERDSNGPSRAGSRKGGSETSDDPEPGKSSREIREAAYQEARARIFKDFVESPPETPPPGKAEKSKRKEQPDDFSGRSQFFPVITPAIQPQHYYPQPVYPDPSSMHMQPPQGPPRFNPAIQNFNPTIPNFNPGAANFNPTNTPYTAPPRQYPYPQQQQQQQPDIRQQYPQIYPQQQPLPQQRQFFTPPPQQRPQQMQPSYSASGYPASPPRPNPYMAQPPQQQRMQQQQPQLGWPVVGGGIPLNARSASAPGHYELQGFAPPPMQGQQGPPPPWVQQQQQQQQQQQAWGNGRMRM